MKVLNTVSNSFVAVFNRKLAAAPITQQPSTGCASLFRRMLGHLNPIAKTLGMPSFQLFGSQPFEYGGRQFELDATWTYPDGAIDGVNASFLASVGGAGFQFILFDHQQGTIHESWDPCSDNLKTRLTQLVGKTTKYIARRP